MTRRTTGPGAATIGCASYCGFKDCPATPEFVSLRDCQECRTHDIVAGRIVGEGKTWEIVDGHPGFSLRIVHRQEGCRVAEIDRTEDPRWPALMRSQQDALIFHHPAWLDALQGEYERPYVVLATEDADGLISGVLPLVYTRGLPFEVAGHQLGRRWASLPRTPVAGPLARPPEARRALVAAAVRRAARDHGVQLQIKSLEKLSGPDQPELITTEWRPTYRRTLPPPGELLSFGNARARHNLQWAVHRAIKLGLTVREAETESELEAWYPLYLDVMRRNMAMSRPFRLFQTLWQRLRKSGHLQLLLVEDQNGTRRRPIAGSIFLRWGETVFYAFTGCRTDDLSTHANDLILWTALHDWQARGARYMDFGECAEEHPQLVRFKTKWGAHPVPQYRSYYPRPSVLGKQDRAMWEEESPPHLREWATRLWRQTPMRITAMAADVLYSWL